MKIGRRKFFQALTAAPLMARAAAEEAVKKLASIGAIGHGVPGIDLHAMVREIPLSGQYETASPANPAGDWRLLRQMRDDIIRKALETKKSRAELEALLYEEHRCVYGLDYDLAANRSMSLAAKVTFQRQRNVKRDIDYTLLDKSLRRRVNDWKERILSIAGIKL